MAGKETLCPLVLEELAGQRALRLGLGLQLQDEQVGDVSI